MTQLARILRKNQTPSEELLWRYLRNRHTFKMKFRRQAPLGPYIVDFCYYEQRFVIEVDGDIHYEKQIADRDVIRQNAIESLGFKVVRFSSQEVMENLMGIIQALQCILVHPLTLPSPTRGEGTSRHRISQCLPDAPSTLPSPTRGEGTSRYRISRCLPDAPSTLPSPTRGEGTSRHRISRCLPDAPSTLPSPTRGEGTSRHRISQCLPDAPTTLTSSTRGEGTAGLAETKS